MQRNLYQALDITVILSGPDMVLEEVITDGDEKEKRKVAILQNNILTIKYYSQTCIKPPCIKRSLSIKRSIGKVPENYLLVYHNIKRTLS